MAFEHKEGKGSIFPNDYKLSENHPDYRGKFMWNGQILEISMWKGETQAGVEKFSISVSVPKAKSDSPQRVVSSSPIPPQPKFTPEDNDPIPF